MSTDERDSALRANVATYDALNERRYISGAPHLKHASIDRAYRSLVDDALRGIGRDPTEVSVLEIGAGSGLASRPWFERHVKLTAVDSSESMLRHYAEAAAASGLAVHTIASDAIDFLSSTETRFDVVTHVSMLHHVPDYIDLLRRSAAVVRPGGSLVTFQDPLRYDRMPRRDHVLERAAYFAWRLGQGNMRRGLRTRWRRLRGVYSPTEIVDFDEYHVVRNGVDSEAIMALLQPSFQRVRLVRYWSTYARLLQSAGERLRLASSFGILAAGRTSS
jgi:SAM-dependent methyltransferase